MRYIVNSTIVNHRKTYQLHLEPWNLLYCIVLEQFNMCCVINVIIKSSAMSKSILGKGWSEWDINIWFYKHMHCTPIMQILDVYKRQLEGWKPMHTRGTRYASSKHTGSCQLPVNNNSENIAYKQFFFKYIIYMFKVLGSIDKLCFSRISCLRSVSYTHLDVYKRQIRNI